MGFQMDPAMTRTRNSQAEKRTSISQAFQAFQDFCTLVANGIGWVWNWNKLRKGQAILKIVPLPNSWVDYSFTF
jgi:hypothetical protein